MIGKIKQNQPMCRIMSKLLIALVLLIFVSAAQAQYKCVVNGKTVYADEPCAANAKSVGELQDHVTEDQQNQRLRLSIKERRERNQIEVREEAEFRARQRAQTAEDAAESRRKIIEMDIRRQRCDAVLRQRVFVQDERELRRWTEERDKECKKPYDGT
jgi:hypothetical protein